MASALDSQKFGSKNAVTMYDFDPGATTATDVGWVDLRDYEGIHVSAMVSVGTGGISSFKILSNSASDGSGVDVEIKASTPTTADAVGDTVHLEATAAEVGSLDADGRYVSAQLALATATDECVVTYIRYGSKRANLDETSDSIA
jgi:hypothetical protein